MNTFGDTRSKLSYYFLDLGGLFGKKRGGAAGADWFGVDVVDVEVAVVADRDGAWYGGLLVGTAPGGFVLVEPVALPIAIAIVAEEDWGC